MLICLKTNFLMISLRMSAVGRQGRISVPPHSIHQRWAYTLIPSSEPQLGPCVSLQP